MLIKFLILLNFIKVLEAAIRPDTSLVSIMMVNNEIGVKQPVKDIGMLVVNYSFFCWLISVDQILVNNATEIGIP